MIERLVPANARVQLRAVGANMRTDAGDEKIVIGGNRNAWSARQLQRMLGFTLVGARGGKSVRCRPQRLRSMLEACKCRMRHPAFSWRNSTVRRARRSSLRRWKVTRTSPGLNGSIRRSLGTSR